MANSKKLEDLLGPSKHFGETCHTCMNLFKNCPNRNGALKGEFTDTDIRKWAQQKGRTADNQTACLNSVPTATSGVA